MNASVVMMKMESVLRSSQQGMYLRSYRLDIRVPKPLRLLDGEREQDSGLNHTCNGQHFGDITQAFHLVASAALEAKKHQEAVHGVRKQNKWQG